MKNKSPLDGLGGQFPAQMFVPRHPGVKRPTARYQGARPLLGRHKRCCPVLLKACGASSGQMSLPCRFLTAVPKAKLEIQIVVGAGQSRGDRLLTRRRFLWRAEPTVLLALFRASLTYTGEKPPVRKCVLTRVLLLAAPATSPPRLLMFDGKAVVAILSAPLPVGVDPRTDCLSTDGLPVSRPQKGCVKKGSPDPCCKPLNLQLRNRWRNLFRNHMVSDQFP